MKIERALNYKCDRCKKEISTANKITIFIKETREAPPKKFFDLCKECYSSMVRGIKKGKKEV